MKFIKLHQGSKKILVNMDNVSEVHEADYGNKSRLYFNFETGECPISYVVDESIYEISELLK